jgi:hypothetical protein
MKRFLCQLIQMAAMPLHRVYWYIEQAGSPRPIVIAARVVRAIVGDLSDDAR